ncbi:MAG: hypothetical protein ACOH2H_26445 [Cypionkella sp.]
MKLVLAAALAVLAAPVFAADPATMTCQDMMAMDSAGISDAGAALKTAMNDDAKISAMADADVAKMAGDACTANPDGTVMDAVKSSMVTSMTCKDLMAMDSTGMMSAGTELKMAMKDDAAVSAMADADVTKMAEDACTAHADGTVMDAMKM